MLEFEIFVFVSGFFGVGELGLTLSFFFLVLGSPFPLFACREREVKCRKM